MTSREARTYNQKDFEKAPTHLPTVLEIDMDTRNTPDPAQDVPQPPLTGGLGRRQLLRGAAAAAPVLLTLKSRTAMAGNGYGGNGQQCTTASAFGSISASGPGKELRTCRGRTPNQWCGDKGNWPDGCYAEDKKDWRGNVKYRATKFGDVFLCTDYTLRNKPMLEVLGWFSHGNAQYRAASHLCAAYLNARSGLTPVEVLSAQTATDIWRALTSGVGYYEPTAGIRWYASETTQWIQSTMAG